MDKKNKRAAEKIIKEFFQKLSFEVELEDIQMKDNTLSLNLTTEEPQILIGEKGKTLIEIQKVLGKMLRKKFAEQIHPHTKGGESGKDTKKDEISPPYGVGVYLDLDINQYKKKKSKYLKELAQDLANRVVLEGTEKSLFPMSSYERRIIHLELAGRNDVKTESIGEEPERKVMIKPV